MQKEPPPPLPLLMQKEGLRTECTSIRKMLRGRTQYGSTSLQVLLTLLTQALQITGFSLSTYNILRHENTTRSSKNDKQ